MTDVPSVQQTYSSYRSYVIGRTVDAQKTFEALNGIEEGISVADPSYFYEKLVDLHPKVLHAISFLIEHPNPGEFSEKHLGSLCDEEFRLRAGTQADTIHPHISPREGQATFKLAHSMAATYGYLCEIVEQAATARELDGKFTARRNLSHTLVELNADIQCYMEDPAERIYILAENLNPYPCVTIYIEDATRNYPEEVASSTLDVDRVIAFGNVFASALSRGESLVEIEDELGFSYDTLLRPCLVPLWSHCGDAVDRIERQYFRRANSYEETFTGLVASWGNSHFSNNRPWTNIWSGLRGKDPSIEADQVRIIRNIPYVFERTDFDIESHNQEPFGQLVPQACDFNGEGYKVDVTFLANGVVPSDESTIIVPVTSEQLANMDLGGITISRSMN
jgi:hypothetical protein